ncbi:MAG: hypothetical protein P8N09_03360 [Planctomycetota bacterium]|nr:hypothetical protein [Planctomycetota bacterium]
MAESLSRAEADAKPGVPPSSSLPSLLFLLLALAVGLVLRVGYAESPEVGVGEWEADGFVATWEGRSWGALNRLRPPGLPLVLSQVGKVLPVEGLTDVRLLSVGFSVLGLMAAWLCAGALASISGLKRRSMVRAAGWMTALWAVQPTLLMASVSPTPELLTGITACLLVASLAYARRSAGWLSWLFASSSAAAFLVCGGILAAVALAVGVVVYLMPVPPVGRALAVLCGLALALGAGWFVQRGPDVERPWSPDGAWTYSGLAMLGTSGPHPNDIPTHADLRARQTFQTVAEAAQNTEAGTIARLWGGRLIGQLLGARRLEPLALAAGAELELAGDTRASIEATSSPAVLGLGAFDLFLRGGLLLFALTVIGLLGRGSSTSSWPRAGVVVGTLVWLLMLAVGGIGPVAVAPFDLLLLGVAGAGVVGADPTKVWTRRLAFAVGGVLLGTFLWTAGWRDAPLDRWTTEVGHGNGEGRYLVSVLQDGGPTATDGPGQFSAAHFLSLWNTPLLRMPEAANRHAAEAWKQLISTERGDAALELLVRTLVECHQYADAARLAADFHSSMGLDDTRSSLLLHWVQDEQRKSENLPIRRL